jgi:sulfur-carrier protein
MKVRLKLIATYLTLLPPGAQGNTAELEVPQEATVGDVLAPLGVPLDDSTVLLLNGLQVEADAPLSDGDMVTAFSAIAGGCTESLISNLK